MKLFNVIVVWDVYAVAETPESARAVVMEFIKGGDFDASDTNAIPVVAERNIREAWTKLGPLVAVDVSDADFEAVKGKTTLDVFKMLFGKAAKPK